MTLDRALRTTRPAFRLRGALFAARLTAGAGLLAATAACVGSGNPGVARTYLREKEEFQVISFGGASYVIDPRAELCVLMFPSRNGGTTATPVSCATLKRNLPEAAPFITWDTREPSCQCSAAPAR